MKSNIYCVLLISTVISLVSSQFRIDYTYNAMVSGWLKLHKLPSTFFDAFRICEAEGAVLASPLDKHLKDAMVALHKTEIGTNCGLFTGIHSIMTKGAFASVEGMPISKIATQWAPNEPDNYNDNEDCVVMLQNGTMADVRCTETFPFICYKKKTVNMALNECGTIDNEYFLDSRTGSCYKFHTIGRNWRRSYMTCMAEGGYLAIINSAIEVEVIKDLYARYPNEKIPGNTGKHVASIGYYDWGESGVWYTIQGQKLQDAGYSTFADGQPDNDKSYDSSGSSCGAVNREGKLDDVWCTGYNTVFICEKNPDSLVADDNQRED